VEHFAAEGARAKAAPRPLIAQMWCDEGEMIGRTVLSVLAAAMVLAAPLASRAAAPWVEVPASAPGDTLAVFYSGDGGWAAIDRGVARRLADGGVAVVGVNSLRYFLTRRSPQGAADDLAVTLRHYGDLWGRKRVVLVGYSFGADALPAIVPDLPADLRAQVRAVVLVGTGPTGDLRFHPASWFNRAAPGAYPVAPAIAAMKDLPLTCIYGDRERHDICAGLPADAIRQVRLPGDHHFDKDYATLGQAILRAAAP
jgi:type IV secretory pathway VirJ component